MSDDGLSVVRADLVTITIGVKEGLPISVVVKSPDGHQRRYDLSQAHIYFRGVDMTTVSLIQSIGRQDIDRHYVFLHVDSEGVVRKAGFSYDENR